MLDINKALRIENGEKSRKTYIFTCSEENCFVEIKCRTDYLDRHSGKCISHAHRKCRPFEELYNRLCNQEIPVELTYEEFAELMQDNDCHYCGETIKREPYLTVKGEIKPTGYFLDRTNNWLTYSMSNCVTCCTECNRIKGDRFDYEEFLIIAEAIRRVKSHRRIYKKLKAPFSSRELWARASRFR